MKLVTALVLCACVRGTLAQPIPDAEYQRLVIVPAIPGGEPLPPQNLPEPAGVALAAGAVLVSLRRRAR